jgi:hypothetical protein
MGMGQLQYEQSRPAVAEWFTGAGVAVRRKTLAVAVALDKDRLIRFSLSSAIFVENVRSLANLGVTAVAVMVKGVDCAKFSLCAFVEGIAVALVLPEQLSSHPGNVEDRAALAMSHGWLEPRRISIASRAEAIDALNNGASSSICAAAELIYGVAAWPNSKFH